MATIPQLQTENLNNITNKVDPQSITPMIDGAERNKVLLELRDRGIVQVATTADLATQSPTNTKIVVIPAVGLFVYADTGTVDDDTVFAAAGTGVWIKKISSTEAIDLLLSYKADLISGKVPAEQLPSYVDDVLEYADFASLPVTGESGKIYVTIDDNNQFRWTGSVYVSIASGPGVAGLDDLTDVVITTPSTGQVLKYNGTEWVNDAGGTGLPDQTGQAGKFLKTDGTVASWQEVIATLLTGYAISSGTVTAADSILTAIQKLAGNVEANTLAINNSSVGNKLFNYYNFR